MKQPTKWIIGIIVVVAAVAIGFLVFKDLSKSASAKVFKIGYFGPMTGSVGTAVGTTISEAFRLAHQENPTAGKYSIEVVYEDDKCDAPTALSAAQKLLNLDEVNILVSGLCSRSTIAIAPFANEQKKVLVSSGAAAPSITDTGDYIFRVSASSLLSGSKAATILENKGFNKVAVLFETEEYSSGWATAFSEAFGSMPGNTLIKEGVTVGSQDVRTQLLKLSQEKPDAYLFIALTSTMANSALRQARELGIKEQIIGNETFSLRAVRKDNPNAEGILVVQYAFDQQSMEFKRFEDLYRAHYGRDIQEGVYAAFAVDTYSILRNAITECGSESECIKDFLYRIQDYNGLSGRFSLDSNGDAKREFEIKIVKNGELANY